MPKRFGVFVVCVLLVCAHFAWGEGAVSEDGEQRDYTAKLGPLEVRVADDVALHDETRGKDLEAKVFYPAEGGPYPLIVFCHGMGDSKSTAPRLMRHWASHGYVCVLPMFAAKHKRNMRFSVNRTWREAKGLVKDEAGFWEDRARDVTFVADSLEILEEKVPGLKGRFDPERIAVGGHSLGACTAAIMGGAVVYNEDGTSRTYKDDRVRAVLLLSSAGSGVGGLTERSWEHMDLPMMVMGGSKDPDVRTPRGPLWRTEAYRFAPPGDKYRVIIMGATHASYVRPLTDRKTDKERRQGLLYRFNRFRAKFKGKPHKSVMYDAVQVASLAFWDACLKDGEAAEQARAYLASDELVEFSREWVLLDRK